jgi:hypothetical protein
MYAAIAYLPVEVLRQRCIILPFCPLSASMASAAPAPAVHPTDARKYLRRQQESATPA